MSQGALLTKMPRAWRLACAFLCALLVANGVSARAADASVQPRWGHFGDIVFRHLTGDTGLPFTGATAMAQDRDGFLWIGSQNGLARWDGQRFRLYRATDGRDGLRDNLIKVLHVDPRGRLWVGTNAGGAARYDPGTDRFIPYGAGPHGLSHAGVRAIADDGRGGLWIATSGGLDRIDPDARTIRRYRHNAGDPDSLPADHVSALLPTADGRLWVGGRGGLALLDPATGRFAKVALPTSPGADQPGIVALARDGGGMVWIGTVGAGAFRYDPARHTVIPVRETDDRRAALETQTITAIAEARTGEIWIGTAGNGIVIVETATGATRRIVHSASVPTSLADDAPVSFFRDHGGMLWVGTQRALSRYDPTRTGIWTVLGGTQRAGALSNQDVLAVLAAADGRIWLGLDGNGVEILDPEGTVTPLTRRAMLPPVPVSTLTQLPDGRVVIGTNAGLFMTDHAGATLAPLGFAGAGSTREVTALLREGSTLWIGRLDGLWRLSLDADSRRAVRVPESDRLGDQRVMSIARGSDGALWIGTQNGLNRVMPGRGIAEPIALGGAGSDGLVPTLLADRQGRLWAGVYGRGIALIEHPRRRGPAVRHIDMAQGLPDANVDKLMQDDAGRIWASTDNGLAVADPARGTVRALHAPDGVAIAAYWSGAGTRTPAGQLLFGGLGGLTIVDPRTVASPPRPAPLVVTELRVGGKIMPEAGFNDRGAHRVATISPAANSLFVEFATLDYAAAEKAGYAYRLRGYQDEWIDADAAHRSASYTNLPPGDYVLEVRAAAVGHVPGAAGLEIAVTVLPAWYQTRWFKLGLALLGIAVLFTVTQLRTAVLKRRQRELERLVEERTTALRVSQRELEQIAYIDVLTGLPNRRMFNDTFRAALERADLRDISTALLLIDLDNFKTINDTHGHDAGDILLTVVGRRLQSCVGEYDSLARLGGDEFAIVIQDATDTGRIDDLCRRITRHLAEPIPFANGAIQPGASMGVALYRKDGATPAELYKASDVALYAAKKRRRGSWAWYGEHLVDVAPTAASSVNRRSLR